jgi:hypothetical protein
MDGQTKKVNALPPKSKFINPQIWRFTWTFFNSKVLDIDFEKC